MATRGKLLFKTPEEMQAKIDAYFEECDGVPLTNSDGDPVLNKYGEPIIIGAKPLTVTGLALALGFTTRQSLLNYQGKPKFKAIIETAKLRIENYAEMRLYDKDGMNGARFNLQNNFRNWDADKQGQDDKKAPAVNIICDIPRAAVSLESQEAMSVDPESVDRRIKELENGGK